MLFEIQYVTDGRTEIDDYEIIKRNLKGGTEKKLLTF
jgi:hypothetical protein